MKEKMAKCPLCKKTFQLEEDLDVNDFTYCSECYEELRVVSLEPPVLEASVEDDDPHYRDEDEEEDEDYM